MKYTRLKSLMPLSVFKGDPCRSEFVKYLEMFGGCEPTDTEFEEIILKCPPWVKWLVDNGYIGEHKQRVWVKCGYKLLIPESYHGGEYIVSYIGQEKYALIGVATGNRWKDPITVVEDNERIGLCVSREELALMLGTSRRHIDSIMEKYKRGL